MIQTPHLDPLQVHKSNEMVENSLYRQKLGLDFSGNFSFSCGVSFPLPAWYEYLPLLKKKSWLIYCRFGDIMIFLLFISNAVMLYKGYKDIRVFTTCFGTVTYIICVTVKLMVFRSHVDRVRRVLEGVHQISETLDNNPVKDREFFSIHEVFIHHVKVFGIGKILAVLTAVVTLAGFEIVFGFIYPDDRKLPMFGWFPFDPMGDTKFPAICFFQIISYLSFLLKDVAIDLLFLIILVSFNSYLIYLRRLLKMIVKEVENKDLASDRKFYNLTWWIKQHQSVLRTIDEFKIISNPYLFITYVSVTVILFFGGVLVTSDVVYDPVQQLIVISINLSNLLQLYIFSFMGDQITNNAHKIADSGFDADLLKLETRIRKLYFYTLMRSKKPLQIQFGSINPLSVHSFGQIMKMCFSYFTTILQIRSDSSTQDQNQTQT